MPTVLLHSRGFPVKRIDEFCDAAKVPKIDAKSPLFRSVQKCTHSTARTAAAAPGRSAWSKGDGIDRKGDEEGDGGHHDDADQ
jgi:hypothetical protein